MSEYINFFNRVKVAVVERDLTQPQLAFKRQNITRYSNLTGSSRPGDPTLRLKFNNKQYSITAQESTPVIPSTPKTNKSLYFYANDYIENYENITELPQNIINDLTNIILEPDASYAFYSCSALTTLPSSLVATWDTSNVTYMDGMFFGCNSLTNIPEMDTSSVISFNGMFQNCSSLPAVFPWVIDCSSCQFLDEIFNGSSVTSVTLKNVSSSIKNHVTAYYLKGPYTELSITFI